MHVRPQTGLRYKLLAIQATTSYNIGHGLDIERARERTAGERARGRQRRAHGRVGYAAGLPAVRALLVEVEVEKTSMVVMEPEVAPEGASTIAELRMLEWSQRAQVAIKIAKAESESMDKARWLFDADWLDTAQRDWAAAAKYVCLY